MESTEPLMEPLKGAVSPRRVEVLRSKAPAKAGANRTLAYLSLVVLVFQNASQVLVMRYARTREKKEMFLSSSAVFWTEILKLGSCLAIVSAQEHSVLKCARMVRDQIFLQPWDTLKVAVPSLIYTVQNNLLYVAVSNLEAATFMVSYQLKILTTALFSVAMLRKKLSLTQWGSLVVLFVGVSMVQLQADSGPSTPKAAEANATKAAVLEKSAAVAAKAAQQSAAAGFGAVLTACLLSGFAGIYFEKILKDQTEISVWMRNVQLAVLSVPMAWLTMMGKDGAVVQEKGLLYGYDFVVWAVVGTYALGGLTVAVVIKYSDNILKGFATSIAIVVACAASMVLFDFRPSAQFLAGTALVMAATYLYSKFPYKAPATDALPR